ncbi:ribbon-helix-helix domain-containing protein [Sulfitobacter sp. F26169L]|uniref:ribbon-helix-helix domain-containing protein n=1 Tax=Sulfitobacter sp. F26169L TaxID=2996015 RepID=UPI002261013E|nr:ribbon-helix-helix domain-containing protein [Sulfitobacter sp. F26169L]MCX7565532.1 ribbon-helix-helix domain-containing protein [Sulfitobacter sp. F26169L]
MKNARPVKHSVTLRGHRTSISLEAPFWAELRAIAREKSMPINALVAEIDAARGLDSGLASAIRVFVLESLRDRLPSSE